MIVWLNPVSGISGDMLLGALLDLGAPLPAVRAAIASTGLTGWQLERRSEQRHGITACRAVVTTTDRLTQRPAAELLRLVAAARPAPVAELAGRAVRALAEVEGRVHGVPAEAVHLHELGGIDTVVDCVGVAAALHQLAVTEVHSAPLRVGSAITRSGHGMLPVPAPATMELVRGMRVRTVDTEAELVTPTGAALLQACAARFDAGLEFVPDRTGYGAGARDLADRPNVLPASLASRADGRTGPEEAVLLEATLDDLTGEVLAYAASRLLADGALDVWITQVIGKKGRPAAVLSVLCSPAAVPRLDARLLAETGSLGSRRHGITRTVLPRTSSSVELAGEQVRVKHGPHRSKPEHEDLARIAATTGRTLRALSEEALRQLPADG